jgi:RHS repeat-associated protein
MTGPGGSTNTNTVTTIVQAPSLSVDYIQNNHPPTNFSVAYGINITGYGWAFDYQNGAPIAVALYIDGTARSPGLTTGSSRGDVQAVAVTNGWSPGNDITPSGWNLAYNTGGLSIGSHSMYIVTTDSFGFSTTSDTYNFTVTKGNQSISFPGLATRTYGDAPATLSATATSGLGVSFSVASGPATISGNTLTITGAGTVTITASQGGNANWNAAANVSQSFTVNPKPVSLSFSGGSFTYNGGAQGPVLSNPSGATVSVSGNSAVAAGNYTANAFATGNYTGSAAAYAWSIAKAAATVTLGSLSQTYDGNGKFVTATTSPTGLSVGFTYNGSSTPPTNAGSYTVVGMINDANHTGSATGTLTIAKAGATIALGNLSQIYDGTPKAVTATSSPGGLTVHLTYDGSASPPTNAGNYAVVATIADSNYTGSASGTLSIGHAAAIVALDGSSLNQSYNGAARTVTATTSPAGLPVSLTYNGSPTAPVNSGTYAIVATVVDPNNNYVGSTTGTLTVSKISGTLTLGGLSRTYNGSPVAATASTSPAGLAVNVTYDGSSTPPVNVGSYAVLAAISDSNYTGSASGTMVIGKASATVTLGSLTQTYDGAAKPASVSTTPAGLAVSFTYNGSPAPPVNAGTYAVTATINNSNYTGSASGTLTIGKATATVTLGSLTQTYDGTARAATATTSPGGLSVTLTYGGSSTAPVAAGHYTVVGTINNANYQGSATGTLIVEVPPEVSFQDVTYGYDGVSGRLKSIGANAEIFDYAYHAGSDFVETVTQRGGSYQHYTYWETWRDNPVVITTTWSGVEKVRFTYGYDWNSRQVSEAMTGGLLGEIDPTNTLALMRRYNYTPRSEHDAVLVNRLTSTSALNDPSQNIGTELTDHYRDWSYDNAGNRSTEARSDPWIAAYTANSLNQYTSLSGSQSVSSLQYDEDGNLVNDGTWDYYWDAENRLAKMVGVSNGEVLTFRYDDLNRRVQKAVTQGGTTITTNYVWEGSNLIAEYDPATSQTMKTNYVWGLDQSGTIGGAGGVGGLLRVSDATGNYYPVYDATGNVRAYLNGSGGFAAVFDHGTFGEKLSASVTGGFFIRFASKYYDEETGLYQYNHRYYQPDLGRFINRDPIGEDGGLNLYSYCGNDGINQADYLGLDPFSNSDLNYLSPWDPYSPSTNIGSGGAGWGINVTVGGGGGGGGGIVWQSPGGNSEGIPLWLIQMKIDSLNPNHASWGVQNLSQTDLANLRWDIFVYGLKWLSKNGLPNVVTTPTTPTTSTTSNPPTTTTTTTTSNPVTPEPITAWGQSAWTQNAGRNRVVNSQWLQHSIDQFFGEGSSLPRYLMSTPFGDIVRSLDSSSQSFAAGENTLGALHGIVAVGTTVGTVMAVTDVRFPAAERIVGRTVLGHYPEYTQLAGEFGARRFNIPTHVWNRMTDAERWAANQKFLDRMIRRGDVVILATPLDKVKPGSYFQRELDYLFGHGYKLSPDGTRLIPPGGD